MLAVIIPFWRITKVTKNGAKRTYKEFFWKIQCRYYVRIHRIGPPRRGPVPRIIVGRLEHYDKKEEILQIQRDLSRSSKETPFHVSEQFPAALVEERKHLFAFWAPAKIHVSKRGNACKEKQTCFQKQRKCIQRKENSSPLLKMFYTATKMS